jgi:hypothetical protein
MKYTHYKHDKYLCEQFRIAAHDLEKYKEYIKQVKYHRDEYWINILIDKGFSISQIENCLSSLKYKSHDMDMNTKISEVKK